MVLFSKVEEYVRRSKGIFKVKYKKDKAKVKYLLKKAQRIHMIFTESTVSFLTCGLFGFQTSILLSLPQESSRSESFCFQRRHSMRDECPKA